jgi:hypothetical protein
MHYNLDFIILWDFVIYRGQNTMNFSLKIYTLIEDNIVLRLCKL